MNIEYSVSLTNLCGNFERRFEPNHCISGLSKHNRKKIKNTIRKLKPPAFKRELSFFS